MRTRRSVTEVARNFSEFVTRVALRGDRVDLVRNGRVVAALVAAPEGIPARTLPQILAELPRLEPREADGFAKDLERARTTLGTPASPWDS